MDKERELRLTWKYWETRDGPGDKRNVRAGGREGREASGRVEERQDKGTGGDRVDRERPGDGCLPGPG